MHRDQKVGLALSVLLLGIVGALCFRNEAPPANELPKLNSEQEIDAVIADGDNVPYLTGMQSIANHADQQSTNGQSDSGQQMDAHWKVPEFLRDAESQLSDDMKTPVPNPIGANPNQIATNRRNNAIAIPRNNNAWEVIGNASNASDSRPGDSRLLLHQVAKGDNLSNLAEKYLGSSSRFREIFESNTDLLKNADDLQVGMKLRIPVTGGNQRTGIADRNAKAGESAPQTNSGRPLSSKAISLQGKPESAGADSANESGRFVPIGRSPLAPGSRDQQGSRTKKPESRPQKLSQSPPADLEAIEIRETDRDRSRSLDDSEPGKAEPRLKRERRYTVRRGDSLERIAIRFYGNSRSTRKIFDANKSVLKNPNAIREGMTLVIP